MFDENLNWRQGDPNINTRTSAVVDEGYNSSYPRLPSSKTGADYTSIDIVLKHTTTEP